MLHPTWLLFGLSSISRAEPDDISNLGLWLRADVGLSTTGGNQDVNTWEDQSANNRDATASGGNRPRRITSNSEVNDLPVVRFDGGDYLSFDGSFIVGDDYTVIVVGGRAGQGSGAFYLAGNSTSTNANLIVGYENDTTLRLSQYGNDLDAVVSEWTSGRQWNLDVFWYDDGTGHRIHHNGPLVASNNNTQDVTSWPSARIGHFQPYNSYFTGDIAEIVIYERALSCEERVTVESELAARWGLPWSSPDDTDGDLLCNTSDPCPSDAPNDGDGDGYLSCQTDCDDEDEDAYPGGTEIVGDGIDQDCNFFDTVACWLDSDLDGFGSDTPATSATGSCVGGLSVNSDDCADGDGASYPGAAEIPGDQIDQNCDGVDTSICYRDDDDDGFGVTTELVNVQGQDCIVAGEAPIGGDCDDDIGTVFPGATETADDDLDQDCNGADLITCLEDLDQDSFGSTETVPAPDGYCDLGQHESAQGGDCDDTSFEISPLGSELPDDLLDQDCNGTDAISCWQDLDFDGWGGVPYVAPSGVCEPGDEGVPPGDCQDDDPEINPLALELENGFDDNCDGYVDVVIDTDTDGLGDSTEVALGTDPLDPDSDDDLLIDGDEIEIGTDPLAPDSDGDGLQDGTEPALDTDGDSLVDPLDDDDDGDGVPTAHEAPGSLSVDTDGDGLPDHRDIDSDGDAKLDADEMVDEDCDGIEDRIDNVFDALCADLADRGEQEIYKGSTLGCGCRSDAGSGWTSLGWLSLLTLLRRRSSRLAALALAGSAGCDGRYISDDDWLKADLASGETVRLLVNVRTVANVRPETSDNAVRISYRIERFGEIIDAVLFEPLEDREYLELSGGINVLDAWVDCAPEDNCEQRLTFDVTCRRPADCQGGFGADVYMTAHGAGRVLDSALSIELNVER